MSQFDIDFQGEARKAIPERLRLPLLTAWADALAVALIALYNRFLAKREAALYRLSHGPQVVYLEAALNDTFDPVGRGIVVTDAPDIQPTPIYRTVEQKPLVLRRTSESAPVPLHRTADVEAGGPDFLVQVPVAVVYEEQHMRAVIDRYRLVSKKHYLIETI